MVASPESLVVSSRHFFLNLSIVQVPESLDVVLGQMSLSSEIQGKFQQAGSSYRLMLQKSFFCDWAPTLGTCEGHGIHKGLRYILRSTTPEVEYQLRYFHMM